MYRDDDHMNAYTPTGKPQHSLRERFGALRNLPPFLRLIWQTSPALTVGNAALRLLRAFLPVAMLFLGKLIIDEVVVQMRLTSPGPGLADWIRSGRLDTLGVLIALEAGLAIVADLLGRASSLVDSLLSERYSNFASVCLMKHAATLDLEQFESSDQQDCGSSHELTSRNV